jgi:hypothetical protein
MFYATLFERTLEQCGRWLLNVFYEINLLFY